MDGARLAGTYDRAFYAAQVNGASRSASAIVPIVIEMFPEIGSVADVGCGTGTWLHHFKLAGAKRVLGLDGGVPGAEFLEIEPHEFKTVDLRKPLLVGERFDLATTFEVAEHLPHRCAQRFVANIAGLSDLILFGAALPGQGGTLHYNERWPSYWLSYFDDIGYQCFDIIRPRVWHDARVEWWYAQNTLAFVKKERCDLIARAEEIGRSSDRIVDVVHPKCFEVFRSALEVEVQRRTIASTNLQPELRELQSNPIPSIKDQTIAQLHGQLEQANRQLGEAQSAYEAIANSTSWRVTKGLRQVLSGWPGLRRVVRSMLGRS